MAWRVQLVVSGIPRTKKTSNRVVTIGKGKNRRPVVLPSAAWVKWVREATLTHETWGVCNPHPHLWRLAESMQCKAIIYRDANRGDLIGYLQGLADLLEKRGIVANDKWIESWDGSRMTKDALNPRIELELTPL